MKDTLKILMEGTPSGISYDSVKKDLLKINGVSNVHDLQMWCITVDKLAVMVHLQVGKSEEVRGLCPHNGRPLFIFINGLDYKKRSFEA